MDQYDQATVDGAVFAILDSFTFGAPEASVSQSADHRGDVAPPSSASYFVDGHNVFPELYGADAPLMQVTRRSAHPLAYDNSSDDSNAVDESGFSNDTGSDASSSSGSADSDDESADSSDEDEQYQAQPIIVPAAFQQPAVDANQIGVFQGYTTRDLAKPDKKMLRALAEIAIDQWSLAEISNTLDTPRYEIFGVRGLSIRTMSQMRFRTHIKNRGYSPLQEAALQIACLICRNRGSLARTKATQQQQQQQQQAVKAPTKRGRKAKSTTITTTITTAKARRVTPATNRPASRRCGKKVFIAC